MNLRNVLKVDFCEISFYKTLPSLLCTNIFRNCLFHHTNDLPNKYLPRHPTVYLLLERKKVNAEKVTKKRILSSYISNSLNKFKESIHIDTKIANINFYVTFSHKRQFRYIHDQLDLQNCLSKHKFRSTK